MSPDAEMPPVILLAEDDRDVRDSLELLLQLSGYVVKPLTSGVELLQSTLDMSSVGRPPAAVISDHRMPEMTGLGALEALNDRSIVPPAILITAFGDLDIVDKAEELAVSVVHKPFTTDQLIERLEDVLRRAVDEPRVCSACGDDEGLRARGAALFCRSCRRIADTSDPDDAMIDLGRGN